MLGQRRRLRQVRPNRSVNKMIENKIHITKLAAAERQLRAAIRMYFEDEDELAIHTVASAAYKVLADLKAERGLDEVADWHLTSFFYVIRDFRRGTLPSHLTQNEEFMSWVAGMAAQLPISGDTKPEDLAVTVSRRATIDYWNEKNKTANFLKHADRDPRAALPLDEIDNEALLMQAYCAYRDLTPDELGNEGLVFRIFIGAKSPETEITDYEFNDLVQKISAVPESERKRLCGHIVRGLNTA